MIAPTYANGYNTTYVGSLEGWYADSDVRGERIGRALVAAAEAWVREQDCLEMASDTALDNTVSQAAHGRLGHREMGCGVHID